AGQLVAIGRIAPRLHQPVDDIQSETGIAEAGPLVQEGPAGDPADVSLLPDHRFQRGSEDPDLVFILCHLERTRVTGWLSGKRASAHRLLAFRSPGAPQCSTA